MRACTCIKIIYYTNMSKKRILLCVYHFIAQDIAIFFKSKGWDVELLGYYENNNPNKVWRHDTNTILKQISNKPTLFFTLNSQHLDKRICRLLRSQKIPVINWFLDDPFSSISPWYIHNNYLTPSETTTLWCIDPIQTQKLAKLGFQTVYRPHITTHRFLNNLPQQPTTQVSFIGNLGLTLKEKFNAFVNNNPKVINWANSFVQDFLNANTRDYEGFLSNYTPAPSPFSFNYQSPSGTQQSDFLKFLTSAYTRKHLSKILPKNNLQIYGDKDWLECISPKVFGGRVNYQTQTPHIYSTTEININITHLQFKDGFNQRILDVLAGGNFLLTDYTPALEEYFKIGTDIVCYKNKDEIPEIIKYYLKNKKQRQNIAIRGKEIVHKHFPLDKLFNTLL